MADRKPPEQRIRRNLVEPPTIIEADGELRGPDLPGDEGDWHPATLNWWRTWRLSAQASEFTPEDWLFMLDTAMLHTLFWRGDSKQAAELRIRVAKYGGTYEDRQRLRLEIGTPKKSKPAKKRGDRRDRVLSVVEQAS